MRSLARRAALSLAGRVGARLGELRFVEREATRVKLMRELGVELVADVGANEGQFAATVRSGWGGPIVSFEPVAATHERLARAAAADDRWATLPYALGRASGTADIHVAANTVFSSLLEASDYCVSSHGASSRGERVETIEVRRLDEVLPGLEGVWRPGRRTYLKMDTQGFDLEVFDGAAGVLDDVVLLQSEVSLRALYDGATGWHDALARYEAAGFHIAGMFPVVYDGPLVVEYDCLMCRRPDAGRAGR